MMELIAAAISDVSRQVFFGRWCTSPSNLRWSIRQWTTTTTVL